jgi:hypothetical protein
MHLHGVGVSQFRHHPPVVKIAARGAIMNIGDQKRKVHDGRMWKEARGNPPEKEQKNGPLLAVK